MFDNFGIPELDELLDLRRAAHLWDDPISPDLQRAYGRALGSRPDLAGRCETALNGTNETEEGVFSGALDDLTRCALVAD